ncbi:MAG: hypothetical protein WCG83_04735 [Candidatus Peregrinibacteria bacterium]
MASSGRVRGKKNLISLVALLTSPASEQYDIMMKVIDRSNRMQAATAKKAEKIKRERKRKRRS